MHNVKPINHFKTEYTNLMDLCRVSISECGSLYRSFDDSSGNLAIDRSSSFHLAYQITRIMKIDISFKGIYSPSISFPIQQISETLKKEYSEISKMTVLEFHAIILDFHMPSTYIDQIDFE